MEQRGRSEGVSMSGANINSPTVLRLRPDGLRYNTYASWLQAITCRTSITLHPLIHHHTPYTPRTPPLSSRPALSPSPLPPGMMTFPKTWFANKMILK